MKKRGRPQGKGIRTREQESAIYAAYQVLRKRGFSHRNAITQLTESKSGLDLESIVKSFEYRPYHNCPSVGFSRIAEVVTEKNKVIKKMQTYFQEWKRTFDDLRKGRIEIMVIDEPPMIDDKNNSRKFTKKEWQEALDAVENKRL